MTAPPVPTTPPTPIAPAAAPETPPAPRAARKPPPQRQTKRGHGVVLYGPAGVQKTTLCALLSRHVGRTVFYDLDDSLPILESKFRAFDIDMPEIVPGIETWSDLRTSLSENRWDGVGAIVIDTGTVAEELAVKHVLKTKNLSSIEQLDWGKGYVFVCDTFMPLLGDLDAHKRAGRHVVIVCHECTTEAKNPDGQNWLRYEPRLQTITSTKASGARSDVRSKVCVWADHVLFLGHTVDVKDGKARGSIARLHTSETQWAISKSRTLVDSLDLADAFETLWPRLLV